MEVILCILYTSIFIWIIHRWKFFSIEGVSSRYFIGVFLLKIAFGLFLWLIYTYHYAVRSGSDAFRYFDDATILFSSLKENHLSYFLQMLTGIEINKEELFTYYNRMSNWYKPYNYGIINDNCTIIRFNALLHLFSWGYYHVHTVFMCFISLLGLTALFKTFLLFIKDRKWELFIASFLIPSVLFWGSGVLKEGLLLFSFGMFIYHLFHLLFNSYSWERMSYLILFLLLLILIKSYILLALIPALFSLFLFRFTGMKYSAVKFVGLHLLIVLFVFNSHHIFPHYNIFAMLQMKQIAFYNVAELWKAGSVIDIPSINTPLKMILSFPNAIINTMFRPHIFEIKSISYVFPAIENLLLLLLFIPLVKHFKKPSQHQLILFYFSFSFVITLAILIGLVTPILGAIIRYKVPLMPFFVVMIILWTRKLNFNLCN